MQCIQFEQILEQLDEAALPQPALAHLDSCDTCRNLYADFGAIRGAAAELGVEEIPVPERVWVSLRNQLEAEHLIRQPSSVPEAARSAWWTVFQRPALAGAFLSLILAAAAAVSYQTGSPETAVRNAPAIEQQASPVLSAENIFKQEAVTVGDELLPGLRASDASVTDSIRRNLGVVDNLIATCEKSVREEPDNELARQYLYGAYQQKAELLSAALNRSVSGGLR
jgi:hypothetical protein